MRAPPEVASVYSEEEIGQIFPRTRGRGWSRLHDRTLVCQNIEGNKFSATGVSLKWVKSRRRKKKKKRREKKIK